MTKPRLVVVGPLPPPLHGVAVSTSLILESPVLRDAFDVEHLDTSDHRTGRNIGRWDVTNIAVAVRAAATLAVRLRSGRKGIVYLPLSQNAAGFLRDSLFIQLAHSAGWSVACHLRGSEFRAVFAQSPRFVQRWIVRTLRQVDSIAVMGDSLRWIFEGLVPAERIVAVPNGTPAPRTVSNGTRDHVVFLSNLRRRKGLIEAVTAALSIHERRPSTHFTFAGSWEDAELEADVRARVRPLGNAVRFLEPVAGDDKEHLLASASVLVFPPIEPEGHPRVVLEALAAGVPVVTTDQGAIRETVDHGKTGLVLDSADPREIANATLSLLEDETLRAAFSRAARSAYLARFTPQATDKQLVSWLMSLA